MFKGYIYREAMPSVEEQTLNCHKVGAIATTMPTSLVELTELAR